MILALLWSIGAYRKPVFIWLLLACSVLASEWTSSAQLTPYIQTIPLLAQAFFVGNLAFLYREKLHKLGNLRHRVLFAFVIFWRLLPFPPGSRMVAPHLMQVFAVVWAGMAGIRLVRLKFPDISYGVYIYHVPVLLFITEKLRVTDIATVSLLLFATVTPICIASWYFIEKPAIRYIRKTSFAATASTT